MALPSNPQFSSDSAKTNYTLPLILVTSLFFLWGLAYGLLDVLNKHFQEALNVTKARSTLLQAAYFGAYFLIALPAGMFMKKYSYKSGIILGLLLYALGAFLFFPSAQLFSFEFFLIALFILAAGLTCLETAANPYVTVLGTPETSAFRLNLSQCFNGLGSFVGPLIAARLFFHETDEAAEAAGLDSVKTVYIIIAVVVLAIAFLFWRTHLPEIKDNETQYAEGTQKPLMQQTHFVFAVVAQFFYVAAQVGIAALFINYCREALPEINNKSASYLLSVSLLLFTAGRFAGTALLKKVAAHQLLLIYALTCMALCSVAVYGSGWMAVYAVMAIFFFKSIMFPTIFALGLKNLGAQTKQGSSFLIMAIAGGAFMPYFMGLLAEESTARAYSVPFFCFVIVALFAWRGYKVRV